VEREKRKERSIFFFILLTTSENNITGYGRRLPDHLLLVHVLPFCEIDVRLAFREVAPRRLSLSAEHRALLDSAMARKKKILDRWTRYSIYPSVCLPNDKAYSYVVRHSSPENGPLFGGRTFLRWATIHSGRCIDWRGYAVTEQQGRLVDKQETF